MSQLQLLSGNYKDRLYVALNKPSIYSSSNETQNEMKPTEKHPVYHHTSVETPLEVIAIFYLWSEWLTSKVRCF